MCPPAEEPGEGPAHTLDRVCRNPNDTPSVGVFAVVKSSFFLISVLARSLLVTKTRFNLRRVLSPLCAAVLVSLWLLLTGCDDPSNVGLGLVGEEQGGQPETRVVDPSNFENTPLKRPTGSLPRVLAGNVDDPLAGVIEADGYMDFTTTASSDFRNGEVQSAELRLRPNYVYGDTTTEVSFVVSEISAEWSANRLPADTTFPTGAVIREFTFLPTDSLVIVPLPENWVITNDEVLRSINFGSEFHGFKVVQKDGNAVVGFGPGSLIRAHVADDAASFPVSTSYSAVRRLDNAALPPDRLLYQAGVGPIASFNLSTGLDQLADLAVNKASLAFQTDTLALSTKPAGFKRPVIEDLDLYGIEGTDRIVLLDRAKIDSRGRFVFEGNGFASELQRIILGTRTFDRYELRLPLGQGSFGEANISTVQGSIDLLLFFDTGAELHAPTGLLTVTPLD